MSGESKRNNAEMDIILSTKRAKRVDVLERYYRKFWI